MTLTVTDVNGNSSTCTSEILILDTVAPVANCVAFDTMYLPLSGNATVQASDLNLGTSDNN